MIHFQLYAHYQRYAKLLTKLKAELTTVSAVCATVDTFETTTLDLSKVLYILIHPKQQHSNYPKYYTY